MIRFVSIRNKSLTVLSFPLFIAGCKAFARILVKLHRYVKARPTAETPAKIVASANPADEVIAGTNRCVRAAD